MTTLYQQLIDRIESLHDRDPSLADVLRAMNKKDNGWYIGSDGQFLWTDGAGEYFLCSDELDYTIWNLAENLSGQSEETQRSLAEVLGVDSETTKE